MMWSICLSFKIVAKCLIILRLSGQVCQFIHSIILILKISVEYFNKILVRSEIIYYWYEFLLISTSILCYMFIKDLSAIFQQSVFSHWTHQGQCNHPQRFQSKSLFHSPLNISYSIARLKKIIFYILEI